MERTRIIKKTAIGLLFLFIIALTCLGIYQYQRIKGISQGTTDVASYSDEVNQIKNQDKETAPESSTVQSPVPASEEGTTAGNEIDDLRYQLTAAEEELAEVNDLIAEEEARKAEEEKAIQERLNKAMEYQKRYVETPEYKEMQLKSLDRSYSGLIKRLNLTPEKKEMFLGMIIDKGTEMNSIYQEFSAAGKGQTPEKLKELTDERLGRSNSLNQEYKEKMVDLIGEDGYETYQVFGNSVNERYLVEAFVNLLDSDEALTEDQKWDLTEAMYKGTRDLKYASSAYDPNATQEERIARNLEYTSRTHEGYLQAAGDILSASQYEKMDAYLKSQRDQLERNLKSSVRSGTQAGEGGGD